MTEHYGDPCYAKAIVLQVGSLRVVFVELDIIEIRLDYADQIKERIEKEAGINRDFIMVAATHNHAYPRLHDRREKEPDRIGNLLAERTSVAVKQAMATLFPARLGVGKTTLRRDIVNNREKLMGRPSPTFTPFASTISMATCAACCSISPLILSIYQILGARYGRPDRTGLAWLRRKLIEARWRQRALFPQYDDPKKPSIRGPSSPCSRWAQRATKWDSARDQRWRKRTVCACRRTAP